MTKKLIIAGANGFIGRRMSEYFLNKKEGWQIIALTRRPQGLLEHENVKFVKWDGKTLGDNEGWSKEIEGAEAIINLVGRTVNCRYSEENKKQIIDSRVDSTTVIGEAIKQCENPPSLWINSSTATIYRESFDVPQTESSGEIGTGFSVGVAKAWENAFNESSTPDTVRKAVLRTSIVMDQEKDTALDVMMCLAKKGLGGKMGSGEQMVSWISMEDTCRAIDWIISHPESNGPYNMAAPNALTNADMMKIIRKAVGRGFGLPATNWMLEIGAYFMRTETELILKSRYAYPEKLLKEGFEFKQESFGQLFEK